MTVVSVSGAGGRMGRLVAEAVAAAEDLELGPLFDPNHAGEQVAGRAIEAAPDTLREADVVVEFTHPGVVMDNLRRWRAFGLHAVVGTSGFDAERIDEARELWGSGRSGPRLLIVPNFSIGAVVMMRLAELAAPHFRAAEVIELHHDQKVDAPSGTALATADRIAAARRPERAVESRELRAGARGADVDGVKVHSVRLPGLVAHQEVLLGNPGETLTVRHDTTDRASFLPGILLAIRSVGDLSDPVTVGLEPILGI